jgi:DNA primase
VRRPPHPPPLDSLFIPGESGAQAWKKRSQGTAISPRWGSKRYCSSNEPAFLFREKLKLASALANGTNPQSAMHRAAALLGPSRSANRMEAGAPTRSFNPQSKLPTRLRPCLIPPVAFIPPETLDQIIAANDIVDVIGGYFPLRRAGAMYKALCPFHQERTPSFTVNSRLQIFKCFGCGAGGNVISFVRDYENLDFPSAAKKLAERAGIRLEQGELSPEDAARHTLRRRLLSLHAEAADFFHHQLLKKPAAQAARNYLKGRGIGIEIAKAWNIGYAPDGWDSMREFARVSGYSSEELIASGLVKTRDEEESLPRRPGAEEAPASDQDAAGRQGAGSGRTSQFYDRFRARVMFPICNDTGQVIAFSGRVLDADAKAAKYVNSPETILFTKGAVLFGLHKSKRAIIDKSSAIVCEGQLDLITIFEAGVPNVIAPQGTAFTEKQARILKRFVQDGEVVLCFDADAAGQKAAERSTLALLAENLLVRVVEMPPGEDPDSLIRGQGAEAFMARVTGAKDFFDYQIDLLASRPEFETPGGRRQAARKMAAFISLLSDPVLREAVMNRVTRRLDISTQEFVRLLKAPSPRKPAPDGNEQAEAPPLTLDPTVRLLAHVAVHDAGARAWLLAEPWEQLLKNDPEAALLLKILAAAFHPGEPSSLHALFAGLDPAEEAAVSGLLAEKPRPNAIFVANAAWCDLERRRIQRKMEAILASLKNPKLEPSEQSSLHEEYMRLKERLGGISGPAPPTL